MQTLEARVANLERLVTQRQQEISTFEAAIAEMSATRDALRAEVERVVSEHPVKDPNHFAYLPYATATGKRASQCDASIEVLQKRLDEARLASVSTQTELTSMQKMLDRAKSRQLKKPPEAVHAPANLAGLDKL